MDEYIEREAAIRGLCDLCLANGKCGHTCKELTVLQSIPAANVREVVRAKWEWDVLDGTPGYRPVVLCCSNCHRVSFSGWSYCPNCGADMRGETDGTEIA